MSLEKFGVLFLLNYFNQMGVVKNHLLLAAKEVLLAVQSSVEIFHQSTGQTALGNKVEFLGSVLQPIQKVLSYSIERITPEMSKGASKMSEAETIQLKEHIVSSIVAAIDDEIENTRSTLTEKNKLKIEALHTVKQVLINQKKKPVAANRSDEKGIAKSANVA